MVLVIENYKGMETNMLLTTGAFLNEYAYKEDRLVPQTCEFMEGLLESREDAKYWHEIYYAANKTTAFRMAEGQMQLIAFLQGGYNDSMEFQFDQERSSKACIEELLARGISTDGKQSSVEYHYEKQERSFHVGERVWNLNGSRYLILHVFDKKTLFLMNMKSGEFNVALNTQYYKRSTNFSTVEDGIEWGSGIYLGNNITTIDFSELNKLYGITKEPLSVNGAYDIEIKEVLSRIETIRADSLGEAIDKAMDMYYGQHIILASEDMKGVDFSPYFKEKGGVFSR